MTLRHLTIVILSGLGLVGCQPKTVVDSPAPMSDPRAADADLPEEPRLTPGATNPTLSMEERRKLMLYLDRNYPASLRQQGRSARSMLWLLIDEQGRVQDSRVINSSGFVSFDRLAQDAVRTVTWDPAIKDGQPVAVWIRVPVSYTIR